jgi:DNA-binding phage protein
MGKVKTCEWDSAEHLDDEGAIADYLADLLADNNETLTRNALDTARRARICLGLPTVDPEFDVARARGKG